MMLILEPSRRTLAMSWFLSTLSATVSVVAQFSGIFM